MSTSLQQCSSGTDSTDGSDNEEKIIYSVTISVKIILLNPMYKIGYLTLCVSLLNSLLCALY